MSRADKGGTGFPRRIWARFTLLYTVIFTASMMLVLALTLVIGRQHLLDQLRAQIQAEIQFLQYEFREDGLAELLEETEERIEKNPADRRLRYVVQNSRGEVLFDEFPTAPERLGWQNRQWVRDGETFQYLFYFQALDGDHLLGVGSSLAAVEQFQSAIGRAFLLTLLIALAIGVASGFGVGAWMSRRLHLVLQALRQVAAGQWQTRLAEDSGGYEFEQLARGLNRMFAQLEQSIANLKYISAGISHDLRTPITRLRNRMAALQAGAVSQAALGDELAAAQQELDGLLSYFDSALLINELQSGELARNFDLVDFSALLEKMLDHYAPLLEDEGMDIHLEMSRELRVRGMPSLLQRLLANLLDNILLHGARGEPLQISLAVASGQLCLTLRNRLPARVTAVESGPLPAGVNRKKMGQKIIQAISAAHAGQCVFSVDEHHHQCRVLLPLV